MQCNKGEGGGDGDKHMQIIITMPLLLLLLNIQCKRYSGANQHAPNGSAENRNKNYFLM